MDAPPTVNSAASTRTIAWLAAGGAAMLWGSQPPWSLWPVAFVAITPWLLIAVIKRPLKRREYLIIWAAGCFYWLISLQGLRHANPALYLCWIALAAYLGAYLVLFVMVCRQMLVRRVPIWLAAPVAWVGQEWIRNYLLTGISAAMLGHSMADLPAMIQIADLFGSYGVGFVVVAVNVGALQLGSLLLRQLGKRVPNHDSTDDQRSGIRNAMSLSSSVSSIVVSGVLLAATLSYGYVRLQQPMDDRSLATFALIQRSEPVEYGQDEARELEMFENYARQSVAAVAAAPRDVDAVVWPESMFTGGLPWMIAAKDAKLPPGAQVSLAEFRGLVEDNRAYFLRRARQLDDAMATSRMPQHSRSLIVGCGIVRYSQSPEVYSGIVHIPAANTPAVARPVRWYGKTHLVMFGEYIPLASYIPGLRQYIRSLGMGLSKGPGPQRFMVNDTAVSPTICIETAVERVTVNQLGKLRSAGEMPDVLVTVTNDGWFDDSSVIDHHLRCAQLVAAACRRPLLSAANNGPTAWIDSCGRIVQRLPTGSTGNLIATPHADPRDSLYLRSGDWPAALLGVLCGVFCIDALIAAKRRRQQLKESSQPL